MNMFEMPSAPQESKENKTKSVWERVSEETVAQLPEEYKQKALELLSDSKFKNEIKGKWDQRTIEGNVNDDEIKQEEIWAKDLVEKIKNRIDI